MKSRVIVATLAGVLCASSGAAHAFEIESLITTGCHERITTDALALSGWPGDQTPPPPSETDRRIIEDLPFHLGSQYHDAWSMALVVGVRDNDLRGYGPTDVAELVNVHNDPNGQADHCLRSREDDGAAGDQTALAECKEFIMEQLALAVGSSAQTDLDVPTRVKVSLSFRGRVTIELSRFAYHTGRALHALQDGYTHTFRNPADGRVRHVLNWIDHILSSNPSTARDGYPHLGVLDDCALKSDASDLRVSRATLASAALLDALRDPTDGVSGRLDRAAAVLDQYLELEPGCTADNDWCGAQERFESSCSAGGDAWAPLVLLAFVLMMLRRRGVAAFALVAILVTGSSVAHADEPPTVQRQHADRPLRQWALYGGLAAALEHGAIAETLAVRWYRWESFALGLDVEHNPWFSFDNARFVNGTINAYATAIYRHTSKGWELRSSAHIGTSVLLFDMVGLNKGTVGAFVGISLLGVAIPIGQKYRLIIDPGHIAIPIPQITGLPFYYGQYRVTIGVERVL